MTHFYVAYMGDHYRVYGSQTGRDREYVGPKFPDPKSACRYADTLEDLPRVSPLRAPAVEVVSLPASTAGVPRGRRRPAPARQIGAGRPHPQMYEGME